MNKTGSVVIFTLMIGMTIIFLALALAPAIVDTTASAMNATSGDTLGLNCSSADISNFDKAACVATDLTTFYFLGALIFIGGLIISSKVVFG